MVHLFSRVRFLGLPVDISVVIRFCMGTGLGLAMAELDMNEIAMKKEDTWGQLERFAQDRDTCTILVDSHCPRRGLGL